MREGLAKKQNRVTVVYSKNLRSFKNERTVPKSYFFGLAPNTKRTALTIFLIFSVKVGLDNVFQIQESFGPEKFGFLENDQKP